MVDRFRVLAKRFHVVLTILDIFAIDQLPV